ncbi:uncharacterized protein PHACADRAFT_265680 [Phanerochaete carnosa HHB-10118-sp]|uniref:Uncharacterized protein n=1 Tax=Phanerochaete carnosa (strain HHB-10118-sp) TaxID=650164 RepID=K5VE17_PHACS|nr:uncharacterized protein PHACADRAFT_265680 [Phanerochaete carnosa HHB-10118-sp]EKM49353.1 hypothetical protein PHACADRAFT_265680 [Phanerochaete carnosa HHB-10118-sp]
MLSCLGLNPPPSATSVNGKRLLLNLHTANSSCLLSPGVTHVNSAMNTTTSASGGVKA